MLAEASEKLKQYDEDESSYIETQQANNLAIIEHNELLIKLNEIISSKIDSIADLLPEEDGFEDNKLDEAKKFLDSKKVTTKKSQDWQNDADIESNKINALKSEIDTLNDTLNRSKAELATKNTETKHLNDKLNQLNHKIEVRKSNLTEIREQIKSLEEDKHQKEQELRTLSAFEEPIS